MIEQEAKTLLETTAGRDGRCQCKNFVINNLRSNMIIPEPNGSTTGRLDQPNPTKAEENDFKHNFMKMMDSFKEEIKNFLKEMEEKTKKIGRSLLKKPN